MVVQRFCKPKVGSSNLSPGASFHEALMFATLPFMVQIDTKAIDLVDPGFPEAFPEHSDKRLLADKLKPNCPYKHSCYGIRIQF